MAETTEFGPRKTIFILAIVAGCFAVLWPKVFYPMLTTSVTPRHSSADSSTCCDVIFESDVNVVNILQEMCLNILKHHQIDPRVRDVLTTDRLSPQGANLCREEVLERCGIDLSTFLAEKEKLGKTHKQVLEEIRSFNSSLCLKINFGVPLSQLGTPHLIRYHILMPHSPIRQERRTPAHAGGLHPALRERGRAIPSSHIVPKIKDRPDHVAIPMKTRPTIGGAGHVVPPPKTGGGSMGLFMPLYTLAIVLFFLYTISKVFRKSSDSEIHSEYIGEAAEREFQKRVFNPEIFAAALTGSIEKRPKPADSMPIPTLEELQELEGDKKTKRVTGVGSDSKTEESTVPCCLCEEEALAKHELDELSPTVKVLGMEMTASSEDGQKCHSRPTTPIPSAQNLEREKTPPKPIYLEGALPPQCELLVTDSEIRTEEQTDEFSEAPVVLSGKMTLSLISLEQDKEYNEDESTKMNGTKVMTDEDNEEDDEETKDSSENVTEKHVIVNHVKKENDDLSDEQFSENSFKDDSDEEEQDSWSKKDDIFSKVEPLEE